MSLKWLDKKKIISFLLDTNFDESPSRVAHKAANLFEVIFESEDSLKKLKQELKKRRRRCLGRLYAKSARVMVI